MDLTHNDIRALVTVAILLVIHFVLKLFKNTPLAPLYRGWVMFWLVFFATLFVGYAKDEVRKWLKD